MDSKIINKSTGGKATNGKKRKFTAPPIEIIGGAEPQQETQQETTTSAESPLDKYSIYRISHTSDVPTPIPVIKMNGEAIATEGNLIVISGNSKSGKSALTAWIIACAIASDMLHERPEGLEVERAMGKAIIHIDTEQAKHKHLHNIKSVWQRADYNVCPDNLLSYNIRQLELNEYQNVTSGICEAAEQEFGGIHLIVIDGIADYIADVNDAELSNLIVKYVESLAIRYKVPVIVIIHTNPGSDKERGHVGSQCQRKCESLLVVKNENDVSYVEPKLLRSASKGNIPLMQFIYDKQKGYHVGCGVRTSQDANHDAERVAKIKSCCEQVFAPPAAMEYETAIAKIMKVTQKQERTAKDFFKEMKAHEMIVKGDDKNWRIKT